MIKTFFIIILFNVGGHDLYMDGWYPYEVDSLERCEKGAENIRKGFIEDRESIPDEVLNIKVSCSVTLTSGVEA
jgi:hypothetical protein